jgi:hypothetical protein
MLQQRTHSHFFPSLITMQHNLHSMTCWFCFETDLINLDGACTACAREQTSRLRACCKYCNREIDDNSWAKHSRFSQKHSDCLHRHPFDIVMIEEAATVSEDDLARTQLLATTQRPHPATTRLPWNKCTSGMAPIAAVCAALMKELEARDSTCSPSADKRFMDTALTLKERGALNVLRNDVLVMVWSWSRAKMQRVFDTCHARAATKQNTYSATLIPALWQFLRHPRTKRLVRRMDTLLASALS